MKNLFIFIVTKDGNTYSPTWATHTNDWNEAYTQYLDNQINAGADIDWVLQHATLVVTEGIMYIEDCF